MTKISDLTLDNIIQEFRKSNINFYTPLALKQYLLKLFPKHFPEREELQITLKIIVMLFSSESYDVKTLSLSLIDKAYAAKIADFKDYITFLGRPPRNRSPIAYTRESDDFLAKEADQWNCIKLLNFLLMLAITPTKKLAIVTSVRDEGLGLLEWIAHYRALGIHDFFIYTNNNTDGSEQMLELLAKHNVIKLIINEVSLNTPIQTKIAEHAVQFLTDLRDFEWIFFIDVDEYFIPRTGQYLMADFWHEVDKAFKGTPPAAFCFNWKWFGSENCFAKTQGLLLERFIHSIHNDHVKSLARLQDIISIRPVHIPILQQGKIIVSSDFTEFDIKNGRFLPVYDKGQLNHYWNKSFEEFAVKKNRGRISQSLSGDRLGYEVFFSWGQNGRQGNYDPPPQIVLERTKSALCELFEIHDLKNLQADIENNFRKIIINISSSDRLQEVFDDYISNKSA